MNYNNYIPDLTERYPEGFITFEEPNYEEGYEPSYGELVATDPDYKEELIELLKNDPDYAYDLLRKYNQSKPSDEDENKDIFEEDFTMNTNYYETLNQELINRGIVYDSEPLDEHEQFAELEGIYNWGFTVITHCNVVSPVITFYDWTYQSILSLDVDEHLNYSLMDGVLKVEQSYLFCNDIDKYTVRLKDGAPVHVDDIACIGYEPADDYFSDKRFYALNNGKIYYKENGKKLRITELDVLDFLNAGFKLVDAENYGSNIDILNDMICKLI